MITRGFGMIMLALVTAFGAAGPPVYGGPSDELDFDGFRWKNRLLIIFTPSEEHPVYKSFQEDIRKLKEDISDRDLVVFHVFESGQVKQGVLVQEEIHARFPRERFNEKAGGFTLILIGKDGGVKLRQVEGFDLDQIFALIDSMPMRQREMEQKSRRKKIPEQ
jgi:hypothetical protein